MQPILAVADGVVTAIQYGHPITGGVSVTLVDQVGRTYHYAGFNDDSPGTDDGAAHHSFQFTALAQLGMPVFAGQVLGYMGDTDPMPSDEHRGTGDGDIWPHLRLTILDDAGRMLDADALVVAAQQRQACHVAIGPWSVPADPRLVGVGASERGTANVSAIVNGGWTLHANGTITAYGRSALIVAPEDCVWAPVEPHGPGALGSWPATGWGLPFKIPAEFWVAGSGADGFSPTALDSCAERAPPTVPSPQPACHSRATAGPVPFSNADPPHHLVDLAARLCSPTCSAVRTITAKSTKAAGTSRSTTPHRHLVKPDNTPGNRHGPTDNPTDRSRRPPTSCPAEPAAFATLPRPRGTIGWVRSATTSTGTSTLFRLSGPSVGCGYVEDRCTAPADRHARRLR